MFPFLYFLMYIELTKIHYEEAPLSLDKNYEDVMLMSYCTLYYINLNQAENDSHFIYLLHQTNPLILYVKIYIKIYKHIKKSTNNKSMSFGQTMDGRTNRRMK